ncbi:MAG: hypothetical protein ACRENG_13425 [bacterium]
MPDRHDIARDKLLEKPRFILLNRDDDIGATQAAGFSSRRGGEPEVAAIFVDLLIFPVAVSKSIMRIDDLENIIAEMTKCLGEKDVLYQYNVKCLLICQPGDTQVKCSRIPVVD